MKDLVLLRHAKARQAGPGEDDRDRPLTQGGRADALAIAAWLLQAGWRPDIVLCSAAARTRETLAVIETTLPCRGRADEPGLYLASRAALRARIRAIAPGAAAAMIVGHNPGLEELAHALDQAAVRMPGEEGFPTATAAWFRSAAPDWHRFFDFPVELVARATPALLRVNPKA